MYFKKKYRVTGVKYPPDAADAFVQWFLKDYVYRETIWRGA